MEAPQDRLNCLKEKFGFSYFRDRQSMIIESILDAKSDNLVIMPTGYGKSLCYQFPSVYLDTITIVISPFLHLMEEQVKELLAKGIQACFLCSVQTNANIQQEIIDRKFTIVYATPEYVANHGEYLLRNIQEHLTLIAVDNAHYTSKLFTRFREDYGKLYLLRELCPSVPILATTAAATKEMRDDIIKSLQLRDPQIIATSIDRPNLEFIVEQKTIVRRKPDVWSDIGPYIENVKSGSIVIYCILVRHTIEICNELKSHNIQCAYYHGQMNYIDRQKVANDFNGKRIRVVIATNAFGMGTNKPNVSLIIHYGMPLYMEVYYHQVGFAGRNGLPAKCVMFYDIEDDWNENENLLKPSQLTKEQVEKIKQTMCDYIQTKQCRRRFILSYFEEVCCDNCNAPITDVDNTLELNMPKRKKPKVEENDVSK